MRSAEFYFGKEDKTRNRFYLRDSLNAMLVSENPTHTAR